MNLKQETITRKEPALNRVLVGGNYRSFDRSFAGGEEGLTLAAGEVVSMDADGPWGAYAADGVTHGVVLEAAVIAASKTATLPVLQAGAIKLSALTNAPAAWKVGQTVGLLILC